MADRVGYAPTENVGEGMEHFIEDDKLHVLSKTDHVAGDKERRIIRDHDTYNDMGYNNEAFRFTDLEYSILKKLKPDLFYKGQPVNRIAWIQFANSSEGKRFRVK